MRNVDRGAGDAPRPDHATRDPAGRRRRRRVAGATGLVVLLGAGTWAVAQGMAAPQSHRAAPADSVQVPVAAGTAAPEVRALMAAGNVPRGVAEQWAVARAADDEPGSTVRRPLAGTGEAAVGDADVTVRRVGKIQVTSARQDLAGQRELSWVADEGEPVGDAHCSQLFRLSPDVAAEERPALLVCWRTSPAKSVYTVAIDRRHRPSKRQSVAQIDRTWANLR